MSQRLHRGTSRTRIQQTKAMRRFAHCCERSMAGPMDGTEGETDRTCWWSLLPLHATNIEFELGRSSGKQPLRLSHLVLR
jgi:hypothetical protein